MSSVTLYPGDVLYIPPFHHVHTESIGDSLAMGIDVLSASLEQLVLLEASSLEMGPFMNDTFVNTEERVIAAQV